MIKKLNFQYLALLALLIFSPISVSAQTGADLVAKTAAVDYLIDEGLKKFDSILNDQQHQLFLNASNLVGVVRTQMSEALGDANRELSRKQIQVFSDLQRIEAELKTVLDETATDLEKISNDLANAVTRVPFADKHPTPTSYSVPVLSPSQNGVFTIKLQGVRLAHEDNHIVLNGKKYGQKNTLLDNEIRFDIPITEDQVFQPGVNSMDIHLFKSRFLRSDKEFVYSVAYHVIPSEIATATIHYEVSGKAKDWQSHSTTIQSTPGGCKTKEAKSSISPRNSGWKFNLDSVKVKKTKKAKGKHNCHFDRNSSNEFSIRARAKGSCHCNLGVVKGCGKTKCKISWKEFKEKDTYTKQTKVFTLKYGAQEVIELPKSTFKYIKVEMKFYNGKTVVIQDPSFEKYFLKFSYDSARQQAYFAFSPSI